LRDVTIERDALQAQVEALSETLRRLDDKDKHAKQVIRELETTIGILERAAAVKAAAKMRREGLIQAAERAAAAAAEAVRRAAEDDDELHGTIGRLKF